MTTERKVTIKRAREVLGTKADHLSDKQIDIILRSLYALSERVIQEITKP